MTMYQGKYANLDEALSDEVKARIAVTRGVTVKSISEDLLLRRATLSARVNGHAPFSLTLLVAVASRLGTTATELVAAAERRRQSDVVEGQFSPDTLRKEGGAR